MPLAVWSVALVISNGIRSAGIKKKQHFLHGVILVQLTFCHSFYVFSLHVMHLSFSLSLCLSLSLSQDKKERLMKFKIVLDFI